MSLVRTLLLRTALIAAAFAGGCSSLRAANSARPAPTGAAFAETLLLAEAEVAAGRFGVADRMLADFAERRADTPEAAEAALWRALFQLDPANLTAGPQDALVLLDGYLHGPVTVAHPSAATSLRRVAEQLDRSVVTAVSEKSGGALGVRADVKPESKPDEKSRDEEIRRLKEELSKANAELERIKRRLAQPNP